MQVITLSNEAFKRKCAKLISKLEFQPDLVVGILNGGGHLLNETKKQKLFSTDEIKSVSIQRSGGLKDLFLVKFLLRKLPYIILNRLRIFESNMIRKSIPNLVVNELYNNHISFDFDSVNFDSIKSILIIDDAIDTGKTMFLVKAHMEKLFPSIKIKIAVLSWTLENSIVKPDYYIFKDALVRFPWSKDYKGKDFE